jgi:hypothetical protein
LPEPVLAPQRGALRDRQVGFRCLANISVSLSLSNTPKEGPASRKTFQEGTALALPVQARAVGKSGRTAKVSPNDEVDLRIHAGCPAPIELCRAFDLPAKSNFATVIARALLYRAVYKSSAVKFLVQLSEGPLPTRKRETEHIDYAAGLAAKELLMKKLERGRFGTASFRRANIPKMQSNTAPDIPS